MKIITESEMNFGKFDETDLFHIENSKIYKDLGLEIGRASCRERV